MADIFQYGWGEPLVDADRRPRTEPAASEANRRDMLIRQTMERLGVSYEEAAEIVRQQLSPRQPSGPDSLADGLDGAPQSDVTPEPVAGTQSTPSRQQLLNQPPESIGGEIMPEGFESLPFDQMHPAYQDYINSLPENSPERKAARERRHVEADAGMANFQEGMDIATNAPMSREELARLRNGGNVWGPRPGAPLPPGVTRGPNHGTLSVKPSAENGWRSYAKPGVDYDPEEHDGTGMNDKEMQEWLESRGPGSDAQWQYDPRGAQAFDNERSLRAREGNARDWNDRHHGEEQNSYWVEDGMLPTQYQTSGTRLARDPVTGEAVNVPVNEPMASTPLKRYTLTADGREANAGSRIGETMESGTVGQGKTSRGLDQRESDSLRLKVGALAARIAAQTGRDIAEVRQELMEGGNVYQDPQTGVVSLRNSAAGVDSIRQAQNQQRARRKETVENYNTQFRSRGPVAGREAARALTMLNSGTLSPEAARAAEYLINPQAAIVDRERAKLETAENILDPLKKRVLDQAENAANPMKAGREQVGNGDFTSPQAQAWLREEAAPFDTRPWWMGGGIGPDDVKNFSQHLQTEYGLSPVQADRAARIALNHRSWQGTGSPADGPLAAPSASGVTAGVPGSSTGSAGGGYPATPGGRGPMAGVM